MAKTSNKEKVGRCIDILTEVLNPFVRRQLKLRFRGAWFERGVEGALGGTMSLQELKQGSDEEEKYDRIDLQALLTIIDRMWKEAFASSLKRQARSYLNEIRVFRNQWAHHGVFTLDEAERAIGTIGLLIENISAEQTKAIEEEKEELNLAVSELRQVKNSKNKEDKELQNLLEHVYEWVLVPNEDEEKPWEQYRLNSVNGEDCIAKASKKLVTEEELIVEWSPQLFAKELKQWIWKEQEDVRVKQVWNYLTQYLYFSRLKNIEVLRQTIQRGLDSKQFFGYAEGKDELDNYRGFRFGELGVRVQIDENSLLIRPDIAKIIAKYQDAEKQDTETAATVADIDPSIEETAPFVREKPISIGQALAKPPRKQQTKPAKVYQRFNGIATLPPERIAFHINQIWEEIIQLVQNLDQVELNIRLDIEAKIPQGIPEHLVRALRENARQLGVQIEFYEE